MVNLIKCPTCGKNNPAGQEVCQYCQSSLFPTGSDNPIPPGQVPTPKITSDLEPVLPDWLRNARDSAQQSYQEEPKSQQPAKPSSSAFSGADLLAGLNSQTQDEEEDIPDWLTNITGETSKQKPQAESPEVRWVEVGNTKDFAQPESESDTPAWMQTPSAEQQDDLTDWLRAADASQKDAQTPQPFSFDSPETSITGETPDWLRSMVSDGSATFNESENSSEETFSSDTPDWLRGLEGTNSASDVSSAPAFSDTPDWLKAMEAENAAPQPVAPSDSPDWLKAMNAETAAPQPVAPSDTPDWLKAMEAESAAPQPVAPSDTPDWLKSMDAENTAVSSNVSDVPDWLRNLDDQEKNQDSVPAIFAGTGLESFDAEPAAPVGEPSTLKDFPSVEEKKPADVPPLAEEVDASDIPSWLKAAAPQSSIFAEPPAGQDQPLPTAASSELPEWLNTLKSDESAVVFTADKSAASTPVASAADISPDSDSLFTDLPDWLSVVDETAPLESVPSPITNVDAIAPGELPSWVQAMRPVDAGIPAAIAMSADKTLETRGALAGLQGVLPAAPGYAPTSKPKAYAIKLQASEEQLSHAALLEQILAAETEPVPIDSFSTLRTSRALRWTLALLFFVLLPAILVMRTKVFALPDSVYVPIEVGSALTAIQAIPQDAPVLAVFDYEPARAGEVESVAVPVFDQLILRHSRLTFVSTNETGAALAERLISTGYLAGHNYESGAQYVNLGYLPGGQMGIRAFADDPSGVTPHAFVQKTLLDFMPVDAWSQPPLAGVDSLPKFSALILITDDADSARAWIEQTTPSRGAIPFIVISSAQAAPMIQPYYASGQVSGLVSGLYGGALFEQYNNQKPGTARAYWDAYSVGTLLAMLLILGGGLISLFLRLRNPASAREAN